MRVVVVGGTGNVGTSVIEALGQEPTVSSILGLARRVPRWRPGKTEWAAADVTSDDLVRHFAGADAVVHLAWLFQPTHDVTATWRVNVLGSMRVFETVARCGVPALVYASSVGAYSPGPGDTDRPVTEDWPTHGWPGAAYAREKAYVERLLDVFERDRPDLRVVRLRPGFIFKRQAAAEQGRLFAGPLLPRRIVRPGGVPIVPDIAGLRFQAVHAEDIGEAYRLAVTQGVRGAFNIVAEPVVRPEHLAELLQARLVRVPRVVARSLLAAAWRLRLVPAAPELMDMALRLPLLDATRARTELGWRPRHTALDALREVIEGMSAGEGMDTPPLVAAGRR